ncbi:hypothetical protein V7S43_009974 [Phytophthora oleae]|uniref:MSP domain-containing protein n=1 Tax=Phytophthora oleae TaxID=2107226 RepID=A0ABD3FGX9_9STRA
MVDVVLPPGSSPAQTVKFRLQHDTEPQSVLTIHNASEDGLVAFKVKTKRPDTYLVQPHQGLIEPNSTASVTLVLLQEERNTLLQMDTIQRRRVNDKFLVQSVDVDRSFYSRSERRSPKEMASELSRMWKQVDRQSISSKELVCFFYRDTADEVQQLQQQLRQSRDDPEDSDEKEDGGANWATSTQISAHEPITRSHSQMQDAITLRKKYDELMAVVAQLTMKRDALAKDLTTAQQQLQQVTIYARDVWEALVQQENSGCET